MVSRIARWRLTSIAVLLAAAFAAETVVADVGGRRVVYAGHFVGHPWVPVHLHARYRDGRATAFLGFKTGKIRVPCEQGSELHRVVLRSPVPLPLTRDGQFSGGSQGGGSDGSVKDVEFYGRLRPRRAAGGLSIRIKDPDHGRCTTGNLKWRASLVN